MFLESVGGCRCSWRSWCSWRSCGSRGSSGACGSRCCGEPALVWATLVTSGFVGLDVPQIVCVTRAFGRLFGEFFSLPLSNGAVHCQAASGPSAATRGGSHRKAATSGRCQARGSQAPRGHQPRKETGGQAAAPFGGEALKDTSEPGEVEASQPGALHRQEGGVRPAAREQGPAAGQLPYPHALRAVLGCGPRFREVPPGPELPRVVPSFPG